NLLLLKSHPTNHTKIYTLALHDALPILTFNEHSSDISRGEKHKIAIIREILRKPEVLLLDEPTSAMDAKGVNELFEVLNFLKKTCIIIITSHDNRLISKCDKIIHL